MTKMRGVLHFSPQDAFSNLDLTNPTRTLAAFKNRVVGYYLEPATVLAGGGHDFACGLVCCGCIDFIAKYLAPRAEDSRYRFVRWLSDNIPQFAKPDGNGNGLSYADRFYDDFRNGLAHEGRIKELGQFDQDTQNRLLYTEGQIMIVNPAKLLRVIWRQFELCLDKLEQDAGALKELIRRLSDDFAEEIIEQGGRV